MKKMIAIAMTALLAGSLTGMAHATAARSVQQQVVSYADLNLDNEADAAVLFGRIKNAARKVCGQSRGLIPMELQYHMQTCVDDATARAVADVNAPLLTRKGEIVVRNTVE
jgi:UrcA family protein